MLRTTLVLSLTPLFASLLAGCFGQTSCDGFKGGTYMKTVELTPDDYAQWACGGMPTPTSGPASTSGLESTGGATTGGATTGGGDTGDNTTGCGEMLTPDEVCQAVCTQESLNGDVASCSVGEANAMGNIPVECELPNVCEGRRHLCVRSRGDITPTPSAAAWLARAAHDEAASVHAFLALAAELADRAPAPLIARLHAAAADETRHAAAITRLAHEHGATVVTPEISATPSRDLLAIAIENAAEGCVRETWAALSAAHQARHADPHRRPLYTTIAADETRHAELAWALDAWLKGQLTRAEYALVEAARHTAAHELHTHLATQSFSRELAALGLPDPATALHLATSLDAALWSQAA
jgi:hypothetical protein